MADNTAPTTIPVDLDTSLAEAKLDALEAKADRIIAKLAGAGGAPGASVGMSSLPGLNGVGGGPSVGGNTLVPGAPPAFGPSYPMGGPGGGNSSTFATFNPQTGSTMNLAFDPVSGHFLDAATGNGILGEDGQALGWPGRGGGGGGGKGGNGLGGFRAAMVARVAASGVQEIGDTLINNARQGRDTQWYDFAEGGGTLGGIAVGAAIGSVVPGIGTLIGATIGGIVGGTGGGLIGNYEKLQEDEAAARSGLTANNGRYSGRFGTSVMTQGMSAREMAAAGALADPLSMSHGQYATGDAISAERAIRRRLGDGDPEHREAYAETSALASVISNDFELGDTVGKSYDRFSAIRIAMKGGLSAVKGYINTSGGMTTPAP